MSKSKNGAPSFLIVLSPNLDSLICFADWMRENVVANEFVRKFNFRLAIRGNVPKCGRIAINSSLTLSIFPLGRVMESLN